MSTNYLKAARQEIQNWELRGPGWLSQMSDFVLRPAQKAAEALIPKGIGETVAKAIESTLSGASSITSHTINFEAIRGRIAKEVGNSSDISTRLNAADDEARTLWNWHLGYVAGEGAAAGVTGLPGLVVDIPALFGLVLRMIQEIGTCYGYDVTKPEERAYMMQILRTASAGELKTKLEALFLLKEVEQILVSLSWRKISADLAAKQLSKLSALAATRQLAKALGVDLTKRKALQMVPIVGALVGGSFNAMFANEVGQAAFMSYRRRWIEENGLPHASGADLKSSSSKPAARPRKTTRATAKPAPREAAAKALKKRPVTRRVQNKG